jgi:hypothetical protein
MPLPGAGDGAMRWRRRASFRQPGRLVFHFRLDLAAMVEGNSGIEQSDQTLIFGSGSRRFGSAAFFCIIIFVIAFIADSSNTWSMPANAGAVVGFLIVACIVGLSAARQWTTEVDLAARRLKISRRSFGRWTKTIVDRPFDECSMLGTIEYNTDGHISYGVYVQLKDGARHAIPLKDSTFNEAARVATQVSDATGIPRLDIKF